MVVNLLLRRLSRLTFATRAVVASTLACVALASPIASAAEAPPAPELAAFVLAREVRPRLVGNSTRFDETLVRQALLDAESARARFRSPAIATCVAEFFASLEKLCDAQPGTARVPAGETPPDEARPRGLELPPVVVPPRIPEARLEEDDSAPALPSPHAPATAHVCTLDMLPIPARDALLPILGDDASGKLSLSLQITETLPPSEADKRAYWRYHGRRRARTDTTGTSSGADAVAEEGSVQTSATLDGEQVPYQEFVATLPKWEDEPYQVRLQLRVERASGDLVLQGGLLIGNAARVPPVDEEAPPAPPPACALDTARFREIATRR